MLTTKQWTRSRFVGTCAGVLTAFLMKMPLGADETPEVSSDANEYKPKTKMELRRILKPIQYKVTQEEGTEPAFRNVYWNNKDEGTYSCVVCSLPLFSSDTKYESGTGWPSFYAPIQETNIGTKRDWKMLYPRTEVHCERCKAHLGHVFNDGPAPTGLRYCMNSASLNFKPKEESNPSKADSDKADSQKTESKVQP